MNTTRRRFLQTAAGAASLGLPNLPLLCKLAAFGAEPPPATMRFGPDLEPVVRLIEETPRDKCVPPCGVVDGSADHPDLLFARGRQFGSLFPERGISNEVLNILLQHDRFLRPGQD